MQKTIFCLVFLTVTLVNCKSQEKATEVVSTIEIEANLDLEVVATIFGESSNLEEFEKNLNNPETKISNLDLNGDNEVDYLRVVEKSKGEIRKIYIQACVSQDSFKDVATIMVKKGENDSTTVTVIGNTAIYGEEYLIEPVYETTPEVVVWLWGPAYRPWVSPYRFGYYPVYYRSWAVVPTARYRSTVRVRVTPTRVRVSTPRTRARKQTRRAIRY